MEFYQSLRNFSKRIPLIENELRVYTLVILT